MKSFFGLVLFFGSFFSYANSSVAMNYELCEKGLSLEKLLLSDNSLSNKAMGSLLDFSLYQLFKEQQNFLKSASLKPALLLTEDRVPSGCNLCKVQDVAALSLATNKLDVNDVELVKNYLSNVSFLKCHMG